MPNGPWCVPRASTTPTRGLVIALPQP